LLVLSTRVYRNPRKATRKRQAGRQVFFGTRRHPPCPWPPWRSGRAPRGSAVLQGPRRDPGANCAFPGRLGMDPTVFWGSRRHDGQEPQLLASGFCLAADEPAKRVQRRKWN